MVYPAQTSLSSFVATTMSGSRPPGLTVGDIVEALAGLPLLGRTELSFCHLRKVLNAEHTIVCACSDGVGAQEKGRGRCWKEGMLHHFGEPIGDSYVRASLGAHQRLLKSHDVASAEIRGGRRSISKREINSLTC
jgi:hypothetical protein